MGPRRIVILTEGRTNPISAKTASCVIRYKPEEVVALLDYNAARQDGRRAAGRWRLDSDRRQPGRCAGREHAADRHRPVRRQAARRRGGRFCWKRSTAA